MIDRLVSLGLARAAVPAEVFRSLSARLAAPEARQRLAARLGGAVVLATCGRVELYTLTLRQEGTGRKEGDAWRARLLLALVREVGATGSGLEAASLVPWVELRQGREAAHHLFRVAAGLDSPILGETEILGQVGRALAEAGPVLDPLLRRLFQAAVAAGRRVRAETPLARAAATYAGLAATALERELGGLGDRPLGVVGSGAVATELALELRTRGASAITVFARHGERARELGFAVEPLAGLPAALPALAGVVTATRSARPILAVDELRAASPELVLVDLGMPPNVDAAAAAARGLVLRDLGALVPGAAPAAEVVAAAEGVLAREVAAFERWVGSRSAVVLAAHGAGEGSAANRGVRSVARRVAARLPDRELAVAFQRGEPSFGAVLDGLASSRVTVVPLMTAEGYYTREALPRALAANARAAELACTCTRPVGVSPRLRDALVARVRSAVLAVRGPVAVLVVGHGTRRHAGSGGSTRALAEAVRAALPAVEVAVAFLDQDPELATVAEGLSAPTLLVLPFLLGGGGHVEHDLGAALERPGRRVIQLPALLEEPALVEAAVELAQEPPPLRLGTRDSRLALWQAQQVAERLTALGRAVVIVPLAAPADAQLDRPIEAFASDGPFTDHLEEALLDGRCDLAVHSLKDLPLAARPELALAALLPRGAVADALVTADGRGLARLPRGARVGTCSSRRAAQLAALRPDLVPVPQRGRVDARVAAVRAGELDAAVLAVAGLERLGLEGAASQVFRLDEMLPAPGQGAIAVQVRRADPELEALCRRFDDAATRAAVTAELACARALAPRPGRATAAVAVVEPGGELRLHARLLDPAGGWTDARLCGRDPEALGRSAAAELLASAERWRLSA